MCQAKCKKLTSFGEYFHAGHSISLNDLSTTLNYLNRAVPIKTTCSSRVISTVSTCVLGFFRRCADFDFQLVPHCLVNYPSLKQILIKIAQPYHLGCFLLVHLRAHLRHAPINRSTLLRQAFRVYPNVRASVICSYPPCTQGPYEYMANKIFMPQKIYRNTGTSEHSIFCNFSAYLLIL